MMHAGPVSHPSRRFLRFSVRGLLALVLVIGAGLGWIVRSARIQREAVAAIERAGGRVVYDFESNNVAPTPVGRRAAAVGKLAAPVGKHATPGWLAELIGVDYFGHVTDVWLYPSSTANDAVFVQVGRLTRLQRLRLSQTRLDDAGLAHLTGLTRLSELDLGSTRVTDAGVAHLKRLTNLSQLYLYSTQVSDTGLSHMEGLTKLSELDLLGTNVTDAGVADLQRASPTRLRIIR
jgi:internalin A